jgi:hypothetical protein
LIANDLKTKFEQKEAAFQKQIETLNQELRHEKVRSEKDLNFHKSLIANDLKTKFEQKEAAFQKQIETLNQELRHEKVRSEKDLNFQKSLIANDLKSKFEQKEAAFQKQIETLNQELRHKKVRSEKDLNDLKNKFEQKEVDFQKQIETLNQELRYKKVRSEKDLNFNKSLITNDLKQQFEQKEALFHKQIEGLNQENEQLIQDLVFQFQIESLSQQLVQKNMRLEQELKQAKMEYAEKKERIDLEKLRMAQPMEPVMDFNHIDFFENMIKMAIADGQLTPNEKIVLQTKAIELGLNYDNYEPKINELLEASVKETNLIDKDKEKGLDFEKYIVQKFSKQYFKILDWAGDKYVNGYFAQTTLEPDLKLQFKHKHIQVEFSVECKYRSSFYKNGIMWGSEQQLKNFQNFSAQKNQPVFIIIGVGGTANAPEDLFLVRLSDIYSTFLEKSTLNTFKKVNFKDNNIFFDYETYLLK